MRPVTRKRIDDAIEKLDYSPSTVARALRNGHTQTIGILVSNLRNRYYAFLVDRVLDSVHRRGYQLLIAYAGTPDEETEALQTLIRRGVDGCLSSLRLREDALLDRLRRTGFPMVFFEQSVEGFLGVTRNRTPAIAEALAFLAERGHRELRVVGWPGFPSDAQGRAATELARQRGIRLRFVPVMPFAPEAPGLLREVCEDAPAAVLAIGWLITNGFLRMIHREFPGYNPDLVGTYHFPFEHMFDTRLAGFLYGDFSRFPELLVSTLIDRIEGRDAKSVVFDDRFVSAADFRRWPGIGPESLDACLFE